jgi:hypothetical protein
MDENKNNIKEIDKFDEIMDNIYKFYQQETESTLQNFKKLGKKYKIKKIDYKDSIDLFEK